MVIRPGHSALTSTSHVGGAGIKINSPTRARGSYSSRLSPQSFLHLDTLCIICHSELEQYRSKMPSNQHTPDIFTDVTSMCVDTSHKACSWAKYETDTQGAYSSVL